MLMRSLAERLSEHCLHAALNDLCGWCNLCAAVSQETQFIVKNAGIFGTEAGDIYQVNAGARLVTDSTHVKPSFRPSLRSAFVQVIATQERRLQNVITFPPSGDLTSSSGPGPLTTFLTW